MTGITYQTHCFDGSDFMAIHGPRSGLIQFPTTDAQMERSEWTARGVMPRHWCYHDAGLRFPDDGHIDFVHWRMLVLRYYGLYQ